MPIWGSSGSTSPMTAPLDAAVLQLVQQDGADQPAVLGAGRDLRLGRADQALVGVDAVALVQLGLAVVHDVGDGVVGRAEHRADVGAEHAVHAGLGAGVHRFLAHVVEDIGGADRDAGGAADALARVDDLPHQEVVGVEAAAVDLRAPGEGPLGGGRAAVDEGSVASEHRVRAREIDHRHLPAATPRVAFQRRAGVRDRPVAPHAILAQWRNGIATLGFCHVLRRFSAAAPGWWSQRAARETMDAHRARRCEGRAAGQPMSILEVIVLAVVQGVTEFLPVSSSCHLVLGAWILGADDPGVAFDVAVHVGTLLALLVLFRAEWWAIALGRRGAGRGRGGRRGEQRAAPVATADAGHSGDAAPWPSWVWPCATRWTARCATRPGWARS